MSGGMASFLRIGPVEVPVAEGGSEAEPARLGQSSRAFDNTLRSTVRAAAAKRTWTFTTPFLEPDDYRDLVAELVDGEFYPCSGLALGDAGVSAFDPLLCEYKRGAAPYGWRNPDTDVTHDRTLSFTLTEV